MPYVSRIHVENCRNVRQLDIDLSASQEAGSPGFRHLILTGPNGSGKSGVLEAIASHMGRLDYRLPNPAVRLMWAIQAGDIDAQIINLFKNGALISAYVPAKRHLHQQAVPGPTKLILGPQQLSAPYTLAVQFLQFLVNQRTELAYAMADGDTTTATRIADWFASFEQHLRRLMDDDGLVVDFDRANFNFRFRNSDGYTFDIQTLADGHAAILSLMAEIFIRIDAVQRLREDPLFQPEGVVIVDEIETHLHLKLQEEILPFLTALFPKLQFIVATHSPAVIASIPNAIVYDFAKKSATLSDELRGVRYGTLMTEHFGISSEIDLDSTEKLQELRKLADLSTKTAEQESEFNTLAAELSRRSRPLAIEVWMIKERLGDVGAASGGEDIARH